MGLNTQSGLKSPPLGLSNNLIPLMTDWKQINKLKKQFSVLQPPKTKERMGN